MNIIFDGPPGPKSGRFVEVEDDRGNSIDAGEWSERTDGLWSLKIKDTKKTYQIKYTDSGYDMVFTGLFEARSPQEAQSQLGGSRALVDIKLVES